jgi:hypothetical protein
LRIFQRKVVRPGLYPVGLGEERLLNRPTSGNNRLDDVIKIYIISKLCDFLAPGNIDNSWRHK